MQGLENIVLTVKWFSQIKGYGFAVCKELVGDVFVHFSAIQQLGVATLSAGDAILCDVIQTNGRNQVEHIYSINAPESISTANLQCGQRIEARIKWFNPSRGYGFATSGSGEDIFLHYNIVKESVDLSATLKALVPGERVLLDVISRSKGLEAVKLIEPRV